MCSDLCGSSFITTETVVPGELHQMTEGRLCQVHLLDDRKLELLVQPKLLSRELLDLVSSHFNLKEKEYFGLTFVDDSGQCKYLQLDRRVLEHDFSKKATGPIALNFLVRFYIESITLLKDNTTVELFFLNAKAAVYNGDIEVESENVFKLAANALQEAKGDFSSDDTTRTELKKLPTLPNKVLKEHPSLTYCEDRVIEHYKQLKGVSRGQAIVKYLTLVESLPTYGVHYYEVKDKQGIPWWLGISYKGIGQYDLQDKLKPRKLYQWKQLENLYFREKKFAVEVNDPHRRAVTKHGKELDTTNIKLKNYNKLLQIPKTAFEDTGEYTCTATNKIGYLEHTITVQIKAAPFWLEKPSNLVLAPEENARLVCRSDGIPRPSIRWFINGDSIEDATLVPNRQVSGDTITFLSVTVANTGVYQCNASNQYGYLFANAYINVLHATPRILRPRTALVKVIEGSRAWLDCRYFGSPVPDLRWSKYGLGNLEGNRFKVHSNGTLQIRGTRMDDQGTYLCIVSNVAGRDENQVKLEVKESTKILKRPDNMRVLRGTDVRLECKAEHDPTVTVTTTWLKNKQFLIIGWRVSLDDSTLVITNVNRGDEGNYTCIIKTEIDKNTVSAHLVVMDRPDPPTNLQLSDPFERSVRLSWTPGDSKHSPIKEYLVQYDDDDWLPFNWRNLSTYPGNLNSVILQLSPFIIYAFRVIAINDIGMSKPSRSSDNFQTGGAPPDAIPKNIKGVGTWRNSMAISWEALNNREWNGPHLKYLVWWKRRDSREEWKNATTWWCKYYIYDTDTFTPYEIKVQAVNDFGLGPESPVIIGYSGEDRPTAAPVNLRVSRIEATKVTVHWNPVARSSIMGELKEYKVYFWRDSSQLRWLSVSRALKSKAFPASGPRLSGVLPGLIPYSNYKMYIVVANNRYEGDPSNTIVFPTPEGTPSAPRSFRIQQRHLDTIWVDWDTPAEPNGIITGYILKYQTGRKTYSSSVSERNREEELRVEEFPPNTTSFAVRRYDRYTRYRFTIAAQTRTGVGEWYTEESPHYTTEANAREQVDLPTQGWVIGVMCAVALFVLILLVVCFIKRSRGGKYPVRDKKEVTLEPVDDKDQEGSFDYRISHVTTIPYSARREEETKVRRGQTTHDTMMKWTESDDSLVDHGDGREIEFNEDGSFIG
ncbi:hypothetical protein J4Q44_G00259240 [Coregonus suidteri]|uniref:Uncharacterized protein n=1 Tax=Coregonus suidteri TaxID=861788 RepID=A0AAN8QG76_9TELE